MSGDDGLTDDIDSPALSKRPATVEAPECGRICARRTSSRSCSVTRGSSPNCLSTVRSGSSATQRTDIREDRTSHPTMPDTANSPVGDGVPTQRRTTRRRLDDECPGSRYQYRRRVDGTVLMGYPGSRQSFWQRIGRSGRGTRDALSVFVPSHSTLDQYILQHPEYVLEEDHERAP